MITAIRVIMKSGKESISCYYIHKLKTSVVTYTGPDNTEPVIIPAPVGEGHTKPLYLIKELLEGNGNWETNNHLIFRIVALVG